MKNVNKNIAELNKAEISFVSGGKLSNEEQLIIFGSCAGGVILFAGIYFCMKRLCAMRSDGNRLIY